MKTPFFVPAVLLAVVLTGCTDVGQQAANNTTSAVSPAPKPSAGATAMDHAAMGHGEMGGSGHGMSHVMGTSGMESLRAKTGDEFDKAFLSQMIAHHEAAVKMARQVLSAAQPETKQDAQSVIDSQQKEIAQMTDWLKVWYKIAPDAKEQALVTADMEGMMAMPTTTAVMFYEMMIPHHQGAVDMSELALRNAGRNEVKELARSIIAAQKAEIAEYTRKMTSKK